MNEMRIDYVDPEVLIPYEKNAKKHPEEQVDQIANSIREFGFRQPIVIDSRSVVVIGHGRLAAALKLGLEKVPVVRADDLTEAQIKALRLADNKTNESEWDFTALEQELDELSVDFDMSDFGFDAFQVEEEPQEAQEDDFDVDAPVEAKAKLGDIYQLGRHRLMCGDSTDSNDVGKLMDGAKADMVFTDPPYNIAYSGVNDKRTILNDKMADDDFIKFIKAALPVCDTTYVCCSWQYEHLFKKAMEEKGMPPKAMIVWNKVNAAQHLDKYFKQHELILYYGEFGGIPTIRGDVWECKRQQNTLHPTMKPIELIAMAINDNPKKENVYDSFGGSGSTLIACEQLNRNCYMMELDPHYVDVIIARWEQFTGQKAVLLNG